MKSTKVQIAAQNEYPCLKQTTDGLTVLFSEPCVGTVVYCPNGGGRLGEYIDYWKMGAFSPSNCRVILEGL